MSSNRIADFFDRQREIIEAAETPFAKFAIFLLPILSPIVPASLTGLHLYKLLLELFVFQYASQVSTILSIIVALVLEMLGYVGAISFIQSVFRLIRTKQGLYILPAVLNGFAYLFYLVAMFLINYQLGLYFKTPQIINNIVGLLSFVTVPTGLLAANHLSQKEEREDEITKRKETREERLERYRIKYGNLPNGSGNIPRNLPEEVVTYQEVSSNLPSNWRKIRPNLTRDQLEFIAGHEPKEIVKKFAESGFTVTPRTASNWKEYATTELRRQ